MEHPLKEELLPSRVREMVSSIVPKQKKLMVATGVVPMPSEDFVLALYQLCHDDDKEISSKSLETLKNTPKSLIIAAAKKFPWSEPLDFLARAFHKDAEIIQVLLANKMTPNSTIADIARTCSREIADLIAGNQARLLEFPKIIEALYLNKNTRMSTVDRIVSFALRNNIVLEGIDSFNEIAASYSSKDGAGVGLTEKTETVSAQPEHIYDSLFESAYSSGFEGLEGNEYVVEQEFLGTGGSGIFSEFDGEGHGGAGVFGEFDESASTGGAGIFGEFDETLEKQKKKQEEEEKEEEKLPLELKIMKLPIPHKIRLATIGTSIHRAILLQDSNRLVALAAIKSPAVNEQEVVRYSQSRSVSADVIRYIAENRNWTKNRFIKVNLVNNPKTPLPSSMSFLHSLSKNELKLVAGNKNIPTALRTAASNMLKRMEGGQKH